MGCRKCYVCIPTWKRGSHVKLSIAIHYLRKIELKSPQIVHISVSNMKMRFEEVMGSRDQASMKTRFTPKVHLKFFKRLLMKTEIDKSIVGCMSSV